LCLCFFFFLPFWLMVWILCNIRPVAGYLLRTTHTLCLERSSNLRPRFQLAEDVRPVGWVVFSHEYFLRRDGFTLKIPSQ
jgi:hypothetical protein